ncbi:sensor histidine kinase [Aquihabitans sp. G128]|uniref:sensor histidine kinase n=1 Tax=Aquihabitans sp. G128 TaxID=2849779 RepID=UPI0020B2ED39|nr:histidine kinase [Aquihabitans sp. G128]
MRRLVERVARGITPRRTDTVLGVLLTLFGIVEALARAGGSHPKPWVPSLAAGLVATVAVRWRRRSPVTAAAVAYAALSVGSLTAWVANGQQRSNEVLVLGGLSALVLLYSVVRYAEGWQRSAVWAAALGSSILDSTASQQGVPYGAVTSSVIFITFIAAAGVAFRYRADLRAERDEQARTGEREQLARELHDVVAHHVSAMVVQASAALAVLDQQPEAARPALQFIKTSGQATMGEMRQMVGILRGSDPAELAPRRGIAGLADLLIEVPGAAPVRLHEVGEPRAVDAPVDQSVLRIVQESVTNARRHGRGARAVDVTLTWSPDRVEARVDNDGATAAPPGASDRGYGLVGMAERARLLGGTFEAGPRSGGGWRVVASLPLGDPAPPHRHEAPA